MKINLKFRNQSGINSASMVGVRLLLAEWTGELMNIFASFLGMRFHAFHVQILMDAVGRICALRPLEPLLLGLHHLLAQEAHRDDAKFVH